MMCMCILNEIEEGNTTPFKIESTREFDSFQTLQEPLTRIFE